MKSLGALDSTTRTPEQTDLARFWSVNFIAQWNEAIRGIAIGHIFDVGDSARLFALANLFAAADAAITVRVSKYFFSFWRPITAIQNRDNYGNPRDGGPSGLGTALHHAALSGLHVWRERSYRRLFHDPATLLQNRQV